MEKFNYYRKAYHLLGFIIPIILYFDLLAGALNLKHASKVFVFSGILFFLLVLIVTEIPRLMIPAFREFYHRVLGKLMKEGESKRFNGSVPYMLSNAIVVLYFPPEIAFLAMMYLLIGDPSAAFFGSKYGGYRFYNGKSLVGVVSFITSTIIGGLLLLTLFQLTKPESPYAIYYKGSLNWAGIFLVILGSITAGLSEFFSGHGLKGILDDNLTIPVSSSVAIVYPSIYFFAIDSNYLIFNTAELFLTK